MKIIRILKGTFAWGHEGVVEPVGEGAVVNVTDEEAAKAIADGIAEDTETPKAKKPRKKKNAEAPQEEAA